MGLRDRARQALAVALATAAVFAPVAPSPVSASPNEPAPATQGVKPRRKTKLRARTSPLPVTRSRWLQGDVEVALHRAAAGDMTLAAQLYRAFWRDGVVQGLIGTRTGGLIRLPKSFRGSPSAVSKLEGVEGRPGLFDRIFPPQTLSQLAADGIVLGIGVAEFVQGDGDQYPTLTRLDPEFLVYRWHEDSWYYRSLDGLLKITPGDGRWVLHTPYGRYEPWNHGSWQALARAFVAKEHAFFYRENYSGKLANPARVAVAPQGAAEPQKQSWFQRVMAWGVNTVFGVTPGYDVKLVELKGEGYQIFKDTIETSNLEYMVSIAGQVVTVTGGAGFANANIHATIRSDLIQGDGNALSSTLETQAIPPVVFDLCGAANDNCLASVAWDTRPPADLKASAESLSAASKAIDDLTGSLKKHGLEPDVPAICARFAVPIKGDRNGDARPDPDPSIPAVEERNADIDGLPSSAEAA
jgi:hypothetical protein